MSHFCPWEFVCKPKTKKMSMHIVYYRKYIHHPHIILRSIQMVIINFLHNRKRWKYILCYLKYSFRHHPNRLLIMSQLGPVLQISELNSGLTASYDRKVDYAWYFIKSNMKVRKIQEERLNCVDFSSFYIKISYHILVTGLESESEPDRDSSGYYWLEKDKGGPFPLHIMVSPTNHE